MAKATKSGFVRSGDARRSFFRTLISTHPPSDNPADQKVFLNDRGAPLTRFGVRYLLRKYVDLTAKEAPTLADKSIHPHSLRHSTAVHLLKAGVDIATISQWLGHSGLNVTMRYARADIDMKRQALEQVFPNVAPSANDKMIVGHDGGLLGWLAACRDSYVEWYRRKAAQLRQLAAQLHISAHCTLVE